MSSLNKVILIGHLGKDPEIRYTPDGAAVAAFSLATSESWNDKHGERQEHTEWHSIVAWNRLAELCRNFLHKGRQVYVEGRLRTREWDDQGGSKRRKTEVVASQIVLLGARPQTTDVAARSEPGSEASTEPDQALCETAISDSDIPS